MKRQRFWNRPHMFFSIATTTLCLCSGMFFIILHFQVLLIRLFKDGPSFTGYEWFIFLVVHAYFLLTLYLIRRHENYMSLKEYRSIFKND